MNALPSEYGAIERSITSTTRWLVIGLTAGLVVVIWISVFTRYVTSNPISWGEQVAKYMMIWAAFLGASLALREGGHIAVNIIAELFPPAVQRVLAVAALVLTALFLLVCLYYGVLFTDKVRPHTDPLVGEMSMAWAYAAIPVGCLLMLVQMGFLARRGVGGAMSASQASLS